MNFKQKVYFLALQRFLSLEDLVSFLNLEISELEPFLEQYGRGYPLKEKYLEEIFVERFILIREILVHIYNHRKDISIQRLVDLFSIDKDWLLNILYYISNRHPGLIYIFAANSAFYSEFRYELDRVFLNRIESSDKKLFRNNFENTEKLKELSKETSIEEISLLFSCSPHIVEEELIFLGLGGYWHNENIRTNYPYFVSKERSKFSKSEIIYLINRRSDKESKVDDLEDKLHATKENLEYVYSVLDKINMEKSLLIESIKQGKFLMDKWLFIKELFSIEKDNKAFLKDYEFSSLFSDQEISNLKKNFNFSESLFDAFEKLDSDKYLFITKTGTFLADLVLQGPEYLVCMNKKLIYIEYDSLILFKRVY